MTTRGQLVDKVQVQLGVPSTGFGFLTPDRIAGFVNDALARVSDDDQWPWLLTSTAVTFAASTGISSATITRPVHTLTIDNRPVRYVGLSDYIDLNGREWSHVWTVVGQYGRISPAPAANTSATLWYYQAEPALDSDNDVPLMDGRHLGAVVAFAAHLGYLARGDEPAAQVQYAEYEQALKALRDDQSPRVGPGSIRLRSATTQWATWT